MVDANCFDLYQHVPPPPPLLDPAQLSAESHTNSGKSPLARARFRQKSGSQSRGRQTRRHRSTMRDNASGERSDTIIEKADLSMQETTAQVNHATKADLKAEGYACICHSHSDDFILTQSSLSGPVPIPLIYRDYTDNLFECEENYARLPCVYQRTRPEDFAALVDDLVDPNLQIYNSGEIVTSTACLLHKSALQYRAYQRSRALQHSEFTFDSLFESGNLDRAVLVKNGEFHLFLTPDTNTQGYMQWFFFSVRNVRKGATVRLNIVNFTKNGSPFGRDMKPSVLSTVRQRTLGSSWTRGCFDIRYSKNTLPRSQKGIHTYFTLSFSYTFAYDHDTVYFAHSEPYTYTRLVRFVSELRQSLATGDVRVEETAVSASVGGLLCPALTVSDGVCSAIRRKVAVTARVHPGETVGSFMMEGFLRFITSQHPAALYLRRACVVLVVPMLNPDGVVAGNTRTGLVGVDLNRKWHNPDLTLHPVLSSLKPLLSNVTCFIDLHGHSKKDGCFMYGNSFSRQDERFWTTRFLPVALAKLTQHFNYASCYFFNSETHDKAARSVMFSEKGVLHSFTLEASFNGSGNGEKKVEFDAGVLRDVGWKLGEAIYGLEAYLMKKSGKEISTQDGVYSLAKRFISRLSHYRIKPARSLVPADDSPATSPTRSPIHSHFFPAEPEPADQQSSGSDSEPERDELAPAEKVKIDEGIQSAIQQFRQKPMREGRKKMGKSCSKFLFQEPVDRVTLKFLGPSQTQTLLSKTKTLNSGKRDDDSLERESRASLIPMRKYAGVVKTLRKHSPEIVHTPKGSGFESYLQLVREVRYRMVSRFPAL